MSSNDFLEFDDDAQAQESSSGRNPFIILAGVLVTILVLASICTVYLLSTRSQGTGEQEATAIAITTQNAITAATNAPVTQTIAAMATEDAQPATETPSPTSAVINTPTPTPTISPTDTPVVEIAAKVTVEEGSETTGEGEATTTGDAVVDAGTEGDATTATNNNGDGNTTQESTPAAAFDSTGSDSTLPQTGLDTWAAILLAIFFVGLLIASRRLRSS